MPSLPFKIAAEVQARGLVVFSAVMDDQTITRERYAPGDGVARRRIAKLWTEDPRLRNGGLLETKHILVQLDQAESAVQDALAAIQAEAPDEEADALERASYADDQLLVELAYNVETASADLIVYDRDTRETSRGEYVDTAIGRIVPPEICAGIVSPGTPVPGTIRVPTESVGTGQDDDLRESLRAFVNRYLELPGETINIAIEYILLTWAFDRFDELPYLAFRTADVGRGKSRALETIGSVCYRPMFAGGGSSAAATLRLLDLFAGTLVADEFDQGHDTELAAALNQILNQGFQSNRPLVKCDGEHNVPRAFSCFGPKIFACRKRFGDDATESRAIIIQMSQRTRDDIPLSLPRREFDDEALALRNRLLAWRFARWPEITIDPAFADPRLEDRSNQIGLPLLAVARSEDVRDQIVTALREQEGTIAADRGDTFAGEILAVVVETTRPGGDIRPGDISREINRRRGEAEHIDVERLGRRRVTPHLVGKVVRQELQLPRLERDRAGARYSLDPHRLGELCERFAVSPPASAPSAPSAPSAQNALFGSVRGVCDVGVEGDVPQGGGGPPQGDVDSKPDSEDPAEDESEPTEEAHVPF